MKKIIFAFIIISLFSACTDRFLDLDPLDEITEAAYFKTPEHFKAATISFYNKMLGWRHYESTDLDWGSDLSGNPQDYGNGILIAENEDDWWNDSYQYLRDVNVLIKKADLYEDDKDDITEYLAIAKFFRGYHHFFLLQRYGGVPIVNTVLDLNDEALNGARSSRHEVFAQVYADLKDAIPNLRSEQDIPSNEKGTISKWAAEAFLAKALLYEATWEMNVGNSTDGDGETVGAGSNKPDGYLTTIEMLTEANTLAKDVMDNGGYKIWDHNDHDLIKNWSNCYLFILEDAGSNPAGFDKTSNNEFILYSQFDFALYQGRTNISHSTPTRSSASRKLMDMFLCSDGLPVNKSPLFKGYVHASDEYQNRDFRLTSYFADSDTWNTPADSSVELLSASSSTGYECRKFHTYNYGTYRSAREESYDYPQIRLAEIYLIYAETLYELNGAVTDAQLDESINLIKKRAGLPALTNAFATANGLDMYKEIMRERAVELYLENNRYHDLKRLGIAEEMLGAAVLGPVIEGTDYENNTALYRPGNWPAGEVKAQTGIGERNVVVVEQASNRNFKRMHYLWPIPLEEINLNSNLLQNLGY